MYWRGSLQQALRHYHDGKFAVALQEFGSVIERTQKPDHPEAVPMVALWYHILTAIQLERYDDAIRDGEMMLDAVLRLDTTGTSVRGERLAGDIQYVLANLQFAGGHAAEAERLYRLVVEGDLGWYMAHAKLAQLYEGQGRWDEAIQERRSAVDANPDDPSLALELGRTLASAGRLPEADSVLQRAVATNPRQTEAIYSLGMVASRLGRSTEARAAFTRFLELAPSRYTALVSDAKARLAALP
jgi:tetratricopeptide (TPR) repeat protein